MSLPLIFCSAALLATIAAPALAQAPGSGRPFRGLFGTPGDSTGTNQRLDVKVTLVQAYDDNLLADSGLISPDRPSFGGHYTMLQAGGQYKWGNEAAQLALTGASAFRHYNRVGGIQTISHAAAAGLSARLARRTMLLINQEASYSPSYLFSLFPQVADVGPGEARPAAPDYSLDDFASYSYGTTASITHGATGRTSISASADYTFTDFVRDERERRDMTAYGVRASLSRNVGRRTALRTGYRYRTGEFGSFARGSATEHGLEVGLHHTRVLSASRQAHVAVDVGVSATDAPFDRSGTARGQYYRLVGHARVGYDFGRTWQARAAYRRGLEYIAELTEPVFVGGFTAAMDGLLSRRADLLVSVGYSSGESALFRASHFDTYTANARTRFALAPSVALYLEYLYYVYDFGAGSLLRPGLSPRLERHGIRAGLTLWVPAFRR